MSGQVERRRRRWGALLVAGGSALVGMQVVSGLVPDSLTGRAARLFFRPLCHQDPARSWMLAAPMCVCHRCFGIYVGLALGGLLALFARADAASRRLWLLAGLPMLLHVALLQVLPAIDLPALRVGTGLLFGTWSAWALASAFGTVGAPSSDHRGAQRLVETGPKERT